MKIFISGQINDAARIKGLIKIVESKGHTITHDWTKSEDDFLAGKEGKLANLEESARRAAADIQGVLDCEVYILCSDNEDLGKGMYVELGAALGKRQAGQTDTPDIYVIGALNHMSIFYLHPLVTRVDSIEEVLEKY